jgi:hypothetical protein
MKEYDIEGDGKIEADEFASMVRLCLKRADPEAVVNFFAAVC